MNDERPTHLDLFSGIGGFALAAQWAGFRTIGFCEIDPYCQKVLAKNFGAKDVSDALQSGCDSEKAIASKSCGNGANNGILNRGDNRPTLLPDIFALNGRDFTGVSLITGGFPCQPYSVAGKRRGAADDRAIWPEMFRVIREVAKEAQRLGLRLPWLLLENVPGIISMELDNVLSDLEGIGYATRAFVIPACAVDAKHRRDRLWIVGRNMEHSEREGLERHNGSVEQESRGERSRDDSWKASSSLPNAIMPERSNDAGNELRGSQQSILGISGSDNGRTRPKGGCCQWELEPAVGRVAHGIPSRVDRLKGLGNAIVPQVAYEILSEIYKLITSRRSPATA